MSYDIVRTPSSLVDLTNRVNASGGKPVGGPFFNHESREWCQAVIMPVVVNAGDTKLKEPKRK